MIVSATSTSITEKKTEEELERIPCIRYPVTFKDQTEALLDSKSEINLINQTFASQLGLKIRKTNVRAQKIDGIILKTDGRVGSTLSESDNDGKEKIFIESFLLADVKPDVVFEISFLIMSNADIDFQAQDL